MASLQRLMEQLRAGNLGGAAGDDVPDLVGDFESTAKAGEDVPELVAAEAK
jgi:hypothetical protein